MKIINRTGKIHDTIVEANNGEKMEGVTALVLKVEANRQPTVDLTLDCQFLEFEVRQAVLGAYSLEIARKLVKDFCLDCGASYEMNGGDCNCQTPK